MARRAGRVLHPTGRDATRRNPYKDAAERAAWSYMPEDVLRISES